MEKKLAEDFGLKLAALRASKKLSQRALAESIGVSKNYIGNLERGEHNVTLEKVYLIAIGLDCSVTELLPDERYHRNYINKTTI